MKNIKLLLLIAISTFAASVSYAQNLDTKQQPQAPVLTPAISPEIKNAPAPAPEYKVPETADKLQSPVSPATADDKMEDAKPKAAPSDNIVRTPEMKAESRQASVKRSPAIPPMVNDLVPPAAPSRKTGIVQQQQQ